MGNRGNDTCIGLGNRDELLGRDGNDILVGGAGRDAMNGNNGNDTLFGETGADTMVGGQGNDLMISGTGSDVMTGNQGRDVFFLVTGNDTDTVRDYQGNDRLGLNGLKFRDLTIASVNNGTLISRRGDRLLLLEAVSADSITSADFVKQAAPTL